jgi:hypothetical protein
VFTFTNHSDASGTHFDAEHHSFARVVQVKYFRSSGVWDVFGELVDIRHFPLTTNHTDKHSTAHNATILDKGSGKKYESCVRVEWEDSDANSTLATLRTSLDAAKGGSAASEKEGSEGSGKVDEILALVKADLINLGINSRDSSTASDLDRIETEAICKLAIHFYSRRDLLCLDDAVDDRDGMRPRPPVYKDAWVLLCYWRGFGNDARAALTATCKWRHSYGVNGLRLKTLAQVVGCERNKLEDYYTAGLMGFAPTGEPIVIRRFGELDLKGMGTCMGHSFPDFSPTTNPDHQPIELFQKAHVWEMEWFTEILREQCYKHNRHVKSIIVLDLKGCGMKQFSRDVMKMIKVMLSNDSDHYPDSLKKLYVINAPGFFGFIWKVIKPYLHPVVVAKVSIVSKPSEVRADLLNIPVPPCCLSNDVGGGTAEPVDGITCKGSFIPFGGWHAEPCNKLDHFNYDSIMRDIAKATEVLTGVTNDGGAVWKTGVPKAVQRERTESQQARDLQQTVQEVSNPTPTPREPDMLEKPPTPTEEKEELQEIVKLLLVMMLLCVVAFAVANSGRECPEGMKCELTTDTLVRLIFPQEKQNT